MGDHGKYYSNFDDSYREALCALLGEADLLLPNLTEAALLSGVPYEEGMTGEGLHAIVSRLCEMGMKKGIITGTNVGEHRIGMAIVEGGFVEQYTETEVLYRSNTKRGDLERSGVSGT